MVDRQTFNLRAGSSILPAPTVLLGVLRRYSGAERSRGAIWGAIRRAPPEGSGRHGFLPLDG